jgi:hypothetical protein
MRDRESIAAVGLVVVTVIIVAVFLAMTIDQYIVCARGGYIGGDCMNWDCFCYEVGEDGLKRFVPLSQVREEIAR